MKPLPHPRTRLIACWATLIALTGLSLTAADAATAGAVRPLGLVAVGLVLAAGLFKAQQILWCYLGLRDSTAAWKASFVAFLLFLVLLIFGAYAVGLAIGAHN